MERDPTPIPVPTSTSISRHPLETAGRIGYAFKGVLYVLLGFLAASAAWSGGDAEGRRGAFEEVAQAPFGNVLLIVLAVGLAAYAVWRLALAALDPEREGSDASGIAHRVGYVVSGASYGLLAFAAFRIVQGGGAGGGGGGAEEGSATVLSLPGGRWVLAAVALAVLGYGVYELVRAYRASFMDKLDLEGDARRHRTTIERLGRAGLTARGVVYAVIGAGLATAAYRYDPDQARGLDQALATVRDQPYGTYLLLAVGLGLAAYGLYCGVNARYRRFEGAQ